MKYFFVLLVFWNLSFAAETHSSKFFSGNPLLEKTQKENPAQKPPNPANLKADWWHYFDVEPIVLKKRIDIETQQLKDMLQNQPEAENSNAGTQINRFIENLEILWKLKNKVVSETPPTLSLQEKYTLSQWLGIIHKLESLQTDLQLENEELLRDNKDFNAMRKKIDSLTAAYLALPEQSGVKEEKGLELMADWSEMAVNGEHLRLQKSAIAFEKAQLAQITKESNIAQKRLSIDTGDLMRLKQEIQTAGQVLSTAREELAQLTVISVETNLETDEGKANALLSEQKVRYATVNEAIAGIDVIRKKIQLEMARMFVPGARIDLDKFRQRLQNRLDRLDDISERLDLWRKEAERDQGLAGKSLAALTGSTSPQSGDIIDLTKQRLAETQNILLSLQQLDSEIHDARLVADRVLALIADREGVLINGWESFKTTAVKIEKTIWNSLETSLFKIGETPVTLFGILRVILIITLAFVISYFVRKGLIHLGLRRHGSSAFLYTVGRLAHYLILIIGFSIGLSSIGVDLSNFALIAGALSLGVGFGLQAIVNNFVSGLILLFERSIRIGDFVELSSGEAGEVRAVNVRSTLVTTPDLVDILVPNSEFVNGRVINWTLMDASRRIHIPFGVAYGSDKELVRKAALEAAERIPYTLKEHRGREPEAWLVNFGDSSLDFELVVWVVPQAVKKPQRVRAAYYWELETALQNYGIVIPFPQRDLHLRTGFQQSETTAPADPSLNLHEKRF